MGLLRLSGAARARLRGPGRLAIQSGQGAASSGGGGTGTGTLSVVEPLNQQGYQRLGSGRSISVSGSFTGEVTQVQMRAVPVGTSITDTSVAWTDIATNVAAQTCSGSVTVLQGAWYVWQARDKTNTGITFTGTRKFGVGIFAVEFGQSNTVNHFSTPSQYPSGAKTSIQFDAGAYSRLGNIADTYPPNTIFGGYSNYTRDGGSVSDGPVYFANMLTAELGVPVFLINSSSGGKPIDYWFNGQQGWSDLMTAVIAAGGDVELAILYQGESNAHGSTAAYMQNAWITIQNQFYTLTGRNASNMKLGMVSLGPGSYGGAVEGEFGAMRVNQATFARTTTGWFYAAGIHDGATDNDYVHINGDSHAKLGRREARSVLALYGQGVSGAGPRIVSATRSGAVITVTVQHAGGTLLKDGAGGNGTALTGFTVRDGGAAAVISSTAITGATTFTLTLASVPSGTVTLEYGVTDVPHGAYGTGKITFVPASCLYDNVAMPNTTVGCPLQPCSNIPVTGA
jgi:hypothetical protein